MIKKTITAYRVTVAEVKKQLNIEATYVDDDAYIQSLIEAATEFITGYICADIEITDCVLEAEVSDLVAIINNAPYISLIKVTNVDTETDVTAECQVVSGHSAFTMSFPDNGNYKIEWKSGYDSLPAVLKQAIIIKAADLFDPERSAIAIGTIVSQTHLIRNLVSKHQRTYWG